MLAAMLLVPAALIIVLVGHIARNWVEPSAFDLAQMEAKFGLELPEDADLVWSVSDGFIKFDRERGWAEWPSATEPALTSRDGEVIDCYSPTACRPFMYALSEAERRDYTITTCRYVRDEPGWGSHVCFGTGENGSAAYMERTFDK